MYSIFLLNSSGVTKPGPTRVLADSLALVVWILQTIAIMSVTSHVMKSYLIRRQYWLDNFIHEKKGQRNTFWN